MISKKKMELLPQIVPHHVSVRAVNEDIANTLYKYQEIILHTEVGENIKGVDLAQYRIALVLLDLWTIFESKKIVDDTTIFKITTKYFGETITTDKTQNADKFIDYCYYIQDFLKETQNEKEKSSLKYKLAKLFKFFGKTPSDSLKENLLDESQY